MTNIDLARYEVQKKNMLIAYLLWWFLGLFGVHRFYMNQPKALLMLIVGIITFLTLFIGIGVILFIPLWIWWFVDAFFLHKWVTKYNLSLLDTYTQRESKV
ncbi:MAG: TM2 domain-containing protein [Sulfurimonas sp.]|nr:TM2 domain-containing protein [Sulfurimonas sp.]